LCGLQVKVLAILDQTSLRNIFWLHRKYDAAIGRAVRAYEEGKSFRQEEELKRLEKYLSLPRFNKEAARARRNVARAEKERKTASSFR
jgi:hypothetical protein